MQRTKALSTSDAGAITLTASTVGLRGNEHVDLRPSPSESSSSYPTSFVVEAKMVGLRARSSTSWRRSSGRCLAVALLAVGVLLAGAGPALADEEGEPKEANLLVLQSVALIVNRAPVDDVAERIEDALAAPDPSGTDLDAVEEALSLVQPGATAAELDQARQLLVSAIDLRFASGYGSVPRPREVGQDESPYATGDQTGTTAVLDELKPARGLSDRGDVVLLALAVLAMAAGLVLAHRWRPPDTIGQLRHRMTRPEEAR